MVKTDVVTLMYSAKISAYLNYYSDIPLASLCYIWRVVYKLHTCKLWIFSIGVLSSINNQVLKYLLHLATPNVICFITCSLNLSNNCNAKYTTLKYPVYALDKHSALNCTNQTSQHHYVIANELIILHHVILMSTQVPILTT